jgi:hypothetical protein
MLFFRAEADSGSWTVAEEYNSVLSRLWHLDTGEYEFIDAGERALGLTFMALSKIWTAIDFTGSDVCNKLVHMLYCTNSTVLRASYPSASFSNEKEDDGKYHSRLVGITSRFITAFSQPLHDSLTCAIVAIKSFVIRENTPSNADEVVPGQLRVLHYIANLLEDLASKIPASGAAADLDKEEDQWHWMELRSQFEEEIGVLEKSFCSGQSLWDNQPRISTPPLDAISCT